MLMAGIRTENVRIDRDLFAVFCSHVSWLRCHEYYMYIRSHL